MPADQSSPPDPLQNLEQLLKRLASHAGEEDRVTIGSMMDAVGRRSFGPVILLIGIATMSPLSGIPTLPSILGITVVLVATQILLGRSHFWLPAMLLRHSLSGERVRKAATVMLPFGRWADRFIRPRIIFLTQGPGAGVILVVCIMFGLTMPPLELLPFVSSAAGVALTVFGLALIGNDGLVAIFAYAITALLIFLAIAGFMF